jgi:hypothetical protein
MMSHRRTERGGPTATGNVIMLRPPGSGAGKRVGAKGAQAAPAVVEISSQSDAMTHEGLSLLRAFLAIEDEAARAALIVMAQKLVSSKV